jgi:hypothetical protein
VAAVELMVEHWLARMAAPVVVEVNLVQLQEPGALAVKAATEVVQLFIQHHFPVRAAAERLLLAEVLLLR